jgi:hypothetical protein
VENQAGPTIGNTEELVPDLIMQSGDPSDRFGRQSVQEAAQSGLVGKSFQPHQGAKQSIVLKDFRFINARQTSDQRIEKNQNQIRWMKINPTGSPSEDALQSPAQAEFVTKPLNQEQASEVSKGIGFKRKIHCLQAFAHSAANEKRIVPCAPQTDQKGRFVARSQNAQIRPTNQPLEKDRTTTSAFFRFNGVCRAHKLMPHPARKLFPSSRPFIILSLR